MSIDVSFALKREIYRHPFSEDTCASLEQLAIKKHEHDLAKLALFQVIECCLARLSPKWAQCTLGGEQYIEGGMVLELGVGHKVSCVFLWGGGAFLVGR